VNDVARMTEDLLDLRVALLRAGVRQRHLADEIGIDERLLNHYLLGRRTMPERVREAILAVVASAGRGA